MRASSSDVASEDPVDFAGDLEMCVLVGKRPVMTTVEYFDTPETVLPAELAYGKLLVREAPSVEHQSAVGAFFVSLREHVRARRLGEVWVAPLDVVLDEARAVVVQPDLLYVSQQRSTIVRRRVHGAPDLVVEVLSPHPRVGDLATRLEWFAAYGVKECWLFHQPDSRLEIVEFDSSRVERQRAFALDDAIVSGCLPEFSMTLRQILEH